MAKVIFLSVEKPLSRVSKGDIHDLSLEWFLESNSDGQFLLDELAERNLLNDFDFNGSYPYSKMLQDQISGVNDSWAVRWYASAFLADKLTLYPGSSLVYNIGMDDSGTHSGKSSVMDVNLSETSINLNSIPITASKEGRYAFEIFFRRLQGGFLRKLLRKILVLLKATK